MNVLNYVHHLPYHIHTTVTQMGRWSRICQFSKKETHEIEKNWSIGLDPPLQIPHASHLANAHRSIQNQWQIQYFPARGRKPERRDAKLLISFFFVKLHAKKKKKKKLGREGARVSCDYQPLKSVNVNHIKPFCTTIHHFLWSISYRLQHEHLSDSNYSIKERVGHIKRAVRLQTRVWTIIGYTLYNRFETNLRWEQRQADMSNSGASWNYPW